MRRIRIFRPPSLSTPCLHRQKRATRRRSICLDKGIILATAWQTRAATQGHATAQYILGPMYSAGERVHQDTSQAVLWIFRSAKQGLAEAQHALGMMYLRGEDVPRDPEKAAELLRKAAVQGNKIAQEDLSESKAHE